MWLRNLKAKDRPLLMCISLLTVWVMILLLHRLSVLVQWAIDDQQKDTAHTLLQALNTSVRLHNLTEEALDQMLAAQSLSLETAKRLESERVQTVRQLPLSLETFERLAAERKSANDRLRLASRHGQTDVVRDLLENGADPNAQDSTSGWNALMEASYHGFGEIVQLLLEKGADPLIRNHNRYSAYSLARHNRKDEILRILEAHEAKAKASGA